MFQDFKSDGFMFCIAIGVLLFVVAQSVFFLLRAIKRGKQIGITGDQIKGTIASSALFSIAPAISIAVTVLVLSVPAASASMFPTRRSLPLLRGSCRWAAFCR